MMTQAEKDFMERTIKAHWLQVLPLTSAAAYAPGRDATFFEAKELAATTNYFERKGFIVPDDHYVYAPAESLKKSFDKWLAIQKHDVKAVNSLHEWEEKVGDAWRTLDSEICELEEMALSPALQIHVDKVLARKEAESLQLAQLCHDISRTINQIKSAPISRKAIVA